MSVDRGCRADSEPKRRSAHVIATSALARWSARQRLQCVRYVPSEPWMMIGQVSIAQLKGIRLRASAPAKAEVRNHCKEAGFAQHPAPTFTCVLDRVA